jgi:hypothetical protein
VAAKEIYNQEDLSRVPRNIKSESPEWVRKKYKIRKT